MAGQAKKLPSQTSPRARYSQRVALNALLAGPGHKASHLYQCQLMPSPISLTNNEPDRPASNVPFVVNQADTDSSNPFGQFLPLL